MRTTNNARGEKRLLVLADAEQKERHSFLMPDGTRKSFFLGTKYSEDNRLSKPTLAQVITECDGLEVGDIVLFTHAVLSNDKMVLHEDYMEGNDRLYLIDKSSVAFYIKGDEVYPYNENILCERLFYPEVISPGGIILSPNKEQVENRLRVLKVPEGVEDIKSGDIVVVPKFSDYELVFNYNDIQQSIIRCLYRDIYCIDEGDYSNCLNK